MLNKTKIPKNDQNFNGIEIIIHNSPSKDLDYQNKTVQTKDNSDIFLPFKNYTLKHSKPINNTINDKNQIITPSINNKKTSIFDNLIGKPRISLEISKKEVLKQKGLYIKETQNKKNMIKGIKENKAINKKEKKEDLFLSVLDVTKEEMEKADEEKLKKEKEQKSSGNNEILQKNLMENKSREFIIQKEEEKKRKAKEKEIKNNSLGIDLSIPIPHINPIRRNKLEKYRSFHPMLNDIFKNVLSFDFYKNESPTEEVPNTFENEAHYRFVWITNFFNELKYCLLNEKIENSEVQNYEDANIKLNLMYLNDINGKLILLKINPNKKLYELKKKIFKDNDIIAVFNDKYKFNKDKITLKNDFNLNYFLGIITRENDSNDLNLIVLREDYEKYIKDDKPKVKKEDFAYDKKIKYLGSINSSLREYKALLDLELPSFTNIIRTDPIFINHKDEEINSKQSFNTSNFYLSEKEIFLKNLQKSEIFNEPQKNAILKANSMKNKDILLIQGPPGTGKTHTILGLISLFLKNSKNSKILVCAPSNAAIDEICARLATKGVFNSQLEKTKCNFIRFGLYDRKDKEKKYLETLNGKILEKYSLEYISDKKYKKDLDSLSERLENLRRQLNNYNKDKINNIGYIKNTEAEISNCLKLFIDKRYQKSSFEHDVLVSIPILCTTLNNAGNERLKKAKLSYEYLIIDEASQCVEPSSLIPLCHDVKKLILVGDHMQLPATVFYSKATKILYNRSLFERLIDNKYPRYILTVQYRMQSNISDFISKNFYDNKLINDNSYSLRINKELFYSIIKIKNNFSFFDISFGEEFFEASKKSYYNKSEIKFSFMLIKKIISSFNNKMFDYEKIKIEMKNKNNLGIGANNFIFNNNGKDDKKENNNQNINEEKNIEEKIKALENYKIAIICAYKSQVMKFREYKKADKFFSNQNTNDIEINTVDSFQGQERDIIILSTVRANFKDEIILNGEIPSWAGKSDQSNSKCGNTGIGFLNDFRRLNVGISRAKLGCFVVGHFETLKNNHYWKILMNYCKEKNSFFKVEKSKESESINKIFK